MSMAKKLAMRMKNTETILGGKNETHGFGNCDFAGPCRPAGVFGLKPKSEGWAGAAFNPDDGRTYSGKVTVSGGVLNTKGCVLGALICKSLNWSQVN